MPRLTLTIASLILLPALGWAADVSLRVRASAAATPCVEAAAREWSSHGGRAVQVETGVLRDAGDWDVLVGSGVETTRALEGGDAVIGTDVDVATIPWVLQFSSGGDVRSLSDVVRSNTEIVMLAGHEAYEARRALAEEGTARVRETTDRAGLRAAPVALVPLSLAGSGRQVEVEVPPIPVIAAVGIRSHLAEAAADFVRYLGSEGGQKVFAACAAPDQ